MAFLLPCSANLAASERSHIGRQYRHRHLPFSSAGSLSSSDRSLVKDCSRTHSSELRSAKAAAETGRAAAEDVPSTSGSQQQTVPTSSLWELDFSSRPVLDERGKKKWELLICSPDRSWQYSRYFPNNKINSTQARLLHSSNTTLTSILAFLSASVLSLSQAPSHPHQTRKLAEWHDPVTFRERCG